jgi:prevent-host-death family protein
MRSWQLQEAKAHLSQVVKEAITLGPQEISLRGEPAVVIISKKDYDKLVTPPLSFIEFMRQSPLVGVVFKVERDSSLTRDIDL